MLHCLASDGRERAGLGDRADHLSQFAHGLARVLVGPLAQPDI
jgi:hypothetical protein